MADSMVGTQLQLPPLKIRQMSIPQRTALQGQPQSPGTRLREPKQLRNKHLDQQDL
jgi:hypothetical protein